MKAENLLNDYTTAVMLGQDKVFGPLYVELLQLLPTDEPGLRIPKELLELVLYTKRTFDPAEERVDKIAHDMALNKLREMFEKEWGYPE